MFCLRRSMGVFPFQRTSIAGTILPLEVTKSTFEGAAVWGVCMTLRFFPLAGKVLRGMKQFCTILFKRVDRNRMAYFIKALKQ